MNPSDPSVTQALRDFAELAGLEFREPCELDEDRTVDRDDEDER